jgi:hypothetical protein
MVAETRKRVKKNVERENFARKKMVGWGLRFGRREVKLKDIKDKVQTKG